MKIIDIKSSKKIQEDWGYGGAAVGNFVNRLLGKATGHATAQKSREHKYYIDALVGGASNAIQDMISSGAVDPKLPAPATGAPAAAETKESVASASKPRVKYADIPKKNSNESRYYRLNSLFEAIILNEKMSIYSFLQTKFLPKFFRGQDVYIDDPHVDNLIREIQNSWAKDQGKAALTKLGQYAFASGRAEGQRSNNFAKSFDPGSENMVKQLSAALAKFKKFDPDGHEKFLQSIQIKPEPKDAPVPTPPAT